jgi:hypothetical protein
VSSLFIVELMQGEKLLWVALLRRYDVVLMSHLP